VALAVLAGLALIPLLISMDLMAPLAAKYSAAAALVFGLLAQVKAATVDLALAPAPQAPQALSLSLSGKG
jgi:hypothetical protein